MVGGRSGRKKRGLGAGDWGLGDEGLPAAGACLHQSLNLSCGSRKPTNPEKEFFFAERSGNVLENKGSGFLGRERGGNVIEKKVLSPIMREYH